MGTLLEVSGLQISFRSQKKKFAGIDNLSFAIRKNETVGIVGESGCGKSITLLAIMRLLEKTMEITNGQIVFDNKDLLSLPEREMRAMRGSELAMIFQDPLSSLNPSFPIGSQLTEAIRIHLKLNKDQARDHAILWLKKVGIVRAEQVFHEYPHMLSGGMRQRVMIAIVLACSPKLLLADEPTTALDVTIQAQILLLMKSLQKSLGTTIILVTHDLGVIAEMADRVIVMYAGQIVEEADVFGLFDEPRHPYTQGLIRSIPSMDGDLAGSKIPSIPGVVPRLDAMPQGCRFAPRCAQAQARCRDEKPPLLDLTAARKVRCWLAI